MKFKKIISIIISAIITVATTPVFSSPLSHNAFNAVAEIDLNTTYDTWEDAYKAFIIDFMDDNIYKNMASNNVFYTYGIKDINSDGTPELMIQSPTSVMPSYLYTFYNNKIVRLIGLVKGGSVSFCKEDNICLASGGSAGYVYNYTFRIQNGEVVIIDDVFWDTLNEYKLNDEPITQSQYQSWLNSIKSKKWESFDNNDFNYVYSDINLAKFSSWQEAYKSVLSDYMKSDSFEDTFSRYELYDVDSNGIPELFISGGEYHFADLFVYSFQNGKLINLSNGSVTGAYGSAYIVPTKSYVYFKGGNQGSYWTIVYELKNNQFIKVATLEDTSIAVSADYYGYKFNGTKVSKSQYDSYVAIYTSDSISDIGRDKRFSNIDLDFNALMTTTTTTTKPTTTTTKKVTTTSRTTTKITTTTKKSTTTTSYTYIEPGPAKGDLSYFDKYDADKATVKPTLSLSRIELSLEEAKANPTQQIELSVKGADGKYDSTGIRVIWDSRLSSASIKAGKAIETSMTRVVYDYHGVFLTTASNNKSKDGVMWEIMLTIPSNCKAGDVYLVEIGYEYGDLFYGKGEDYSDLMQAWTYTKGIVQGYIKIKDTETPITNITSSSSSVTTTKTTTTQVTLSTEKTNIILDNGEQYTIPNARNGLTYKSNNTDVAIVSSKGVITAIGVGNAIISVIDSEWNVVQLKITVNKAKMTVILPGDSNMDDQVDLSDVVLIMQALANPNKYGLSGSDKSHLTEQGAANADVAEHGDGVTAGDALRIQEYLLKKVASLAPLALQ